MTYHSIGRLEDLEDGVATRVEIEETPVAVVRDGQCVYALDDRCSHEDTSLSEGWYENGALQCPEHGSSFDCKTGAVMSLPASVPIRVFPVRITDGNVEIGGVEDAIGVG